MSAMAINEREYGQLSERVQNLSVRLEEVRAEVKAIDGKVDGILARFDRIDGGMKVAMAVSGFFGAGAMLLLTKVLPFLFAGLPRI